MYSRSLYCPDFGLADHFLNLVPATAFFPRQLLPGEVSRLAQTGPDEIGAF